MCSTKACEEDKRKNSQCEFFHTDRGIYMDVKKLCRKFDKPDVLVWAIRGRTCWLAKLPTSTKRNVSGVLNVINKAIYDKYWKIVIS